MGRGATAFEKPSVGECMHASRGASWRQCLLAVPVLTVAYFIGDSDALILACSEDSYNYFNAAAQQAEQEAAQAEADRLRAEQEAIDPSMPTSNLVDLALAQQQASSSSSTDVALRSHLVNIVPPASVAMVKHAIKIRVSRGGYLEFIANATTLYNKDIVLCYARVCWWCYVNNLPCEVITKSIIRTIGVECASVEEDAAEEYQATNWQYSLRGARGRARQALRPLKTGPSSSSVWAGGARRCPSTPSTT